MGLELRPLCTGILSYSPKLFKIVERTLQLGSGNTASAEYCLSAWCTLIAAGTASGLSQIPRRVAELGPGATLGTGIAALVSGAETYRALDLVAYTDPHAALSMFDPIVDLFQHPNGFKTRSAFSELNENLNDRGFLTPLISSDDFKRLLDPERLRNLRAEVASQKNLSYSAPWYDSSVIREGTVDLLFSNAVLEHVDDLNVTHRAARAWLSPGGICIHRVDFGCHGVTTEWNGQWTLSPMIWKLVRGKRSYSINRLPLSEQRQALQRAGFEIIGEFIHRIPSAIQRHQLKAPFHNLDDSDLTARQAILVGRRVD